MKLYSQEFRSMLVQAANTVEEQTSAEIMVVVQPRAADYSDIPLRLSAALSFVAFSFMMLAPYPFSDHTIFAGTLLSFAAGICIGIVPWISRGVAGRKRLKRNAEIMARAVFQKAGMHHTRRKVGMFIFFSVFEQQVLLLPDRGVEQAIPQEEWETMKRSLAAVFDSSHPAEAVIAGIEALSGVFSLYLPKGPDDLDELPEIIDLRFGEQ